MFGPLMERDNPLNPLPSSSSPPPTHFVWVLFLSRSTYLPLYACMCDCVRIYLSVYISLFTSLPLTLSLSPSSLYLFIFLSIPLSLSVCLYVAFSLSASLATWMYNAAQNLPMHTYLSLLHILLRNSKLTVGLLFTEILDNLTSFSFFTFPWVCPLWSIPTETLRNWWLNGYGPCHTVITTAR